MAGTVNVKEVAVAADTVAVVVPSCTRLLAALALKFEPVIVTDAPGVAEVGENEVIVGVGGTTENGIAEFAVCDVSPFCFTVT